MDRREFLGIGLAAVTGATARALGAIDEGWKRLGSRRVDLGGIDHDEVPCGFSGFLKAIVIEVRGAAVNFLDVKIVFGNGDVIDAPIRSLVRAGERSRVIDLPGNKRVVNRVQFRYRPARGVRAEVVVWGKE